MFKANFDTEMISVRIGMVFARLGISPNAWTLVSILPAIAGFITLVLYRNLPASLILFMAAGFIDAIDGAVARVTRTVSALGAFLDGIIDRYVEILLYVGLMVYLYTAEEFLIPNAFWVALLIFGSMMPTYIRAYADHRKVVTDAKAHKKMGGLLERAERLILVYLGMFLGSYNTLWLVYVIAAAAILSNYTAFQRLWFVVRYKAGE
jgi:phosphatidylglycerophosphate synthase